MKFRYLDGLRGIAALTVVFDHLTFIFLPFAVNGSGTSHRLGRLLHDTPLYLLIDGDLAVCLFFVLSGFVLSAKFFRTGDNNVVIASAVKRYFRLGIPVLGSVLLAYVLLRLGLMHNHEAGVLSSAWWEAFWSFPASLKDALYEATYGAFFHDSSVYNPVLWTMKLELWGSFLVFGVLLLFSRLRNRWVIYLLLMLALWHSYFPAFIFGVVLCDYWHHREREGSPMQLASRYWIPLLAVSLVLGSYPITGVQGTIFAKVSLPVLGPFFPVQAHVVAAMGIITAILSSNILQRGLSLRLPLFLGWISFPLYLLHFSILGSYTSYLFVHLTHQMSHKLAAVVAIGPTLAICISAAYIYAKYVDGPAITFSGWVYRRFFSKPMPERVRTQPIPGRPAMPAPATPANVMGAPGAELT